MSGWKPRQIILLYTSMCVMFNLLRAFKSLKCVSYILATSGFGTKGLADLFMSAFLIMLI